MSLARGRGKKNLVFSLSGTRMVEPQSGGSGSIPKATIHPLQATFPSTYLNYLSEPQTRLWSIGKIRG
jgi:hypothetical protein